MARICGVDIGGTFTDTVLLDDGAVVLGKAPSTPPNFEQGFIDSLGSAAARAGYELGELLAGTDSLYHGCTVGTNALVEGRTAKVGLLTTRGARDTIFIMQGGGRLSGLPPEQLAHVAGHTKPEPLVPKHLVGEVDERVTFDGRALVELNEEQCSEQIASLLEQGVEAFAICFLWSVVNPEHEQRAAELVRAQAPDAFVTASSEVIPRSGEYERTVATVINAGIGPVMDAYLGNLEARLAELEYTNPLHIMSCSGGVIDSRFARRLPLLTIGSGPVGGLIGSGALARVEADSAPTGSSLNVITGDMGGTTFDVGVIRDGRPLSRTSSRHGQYEYFVPTLDVRSIGAGGGSIIRYDEGLRALRVGPMSAGADPGPVAYRKGGDRPTVTDADLVLGYLNPDYFLGGDIGLSLDVAREALAKVGEPLGFSAEETAAAAVRIVDNQMADAIRLASVQQGYDPRNHVLYAYGGAGPVHGPALARGLNLARLVVPLGDLAAGWSAFGAVSSDAVAVQEMPAAMTYPFDPEALNKNWEEIEGRVALQLESQGLSGESATWERLAEMRYATQVNEVTVIAPRGRYDVGTVEELRDIFESEYERLFGRGSGYADAGHVLTVMRVKASAPVGGFSLAPVAGGGGGQPEKKSERQVIFYESGLEPLPTPVYDGASLAPGMVVEGPAIVEFVNTTLVVRDGQRAGVDGLGSVTVDL